MPETSPDPDVSRAIESAELLLHIAKRERVNVSIASLARGLKVGVDDPAAMAELRRVIDGLKASGDIEEWIGPSGRDLVCLTPGAAALHGLRPNRRSTRWIRNGVLPKPEKSRTRPVKDGTKMICETDMGDEPAGMLANTPDRRTEIVDDIDFGLGMILADEKRMGLIRPTLPIVGVKPWTAQDWERDHDLNGKPFPGGGLGKPPRGGLPPCEVCGGREMREMVSLVPVRLGRNRMARPPAIQDGGECCARCLNHWQDSRWPKVVRLAPEPKGKVAG